MPNLSSGFLRARPMRINTNASLQKIGEALDRTRPKLAQLSRGWGSIHDDVNVLNLPDVAPTPGDAAVLPEENRGDPTLVLPPHHADGVALPRPTEPAQLHQTLVARLYWWERDTSLRRVLGDQVSPTRWHRLKAADIMLTPISGSSDLNLLVSTWNEAEISSQVLPALNVALQRVDGAATIDTTTSELNLVSDDFFLWLLHRHLNQLPLTGDLVIEDMRSIYVQDPLDHGNYLWRGVDTTRLELVGHIAEQKIFGPARVAIRSDLLEGLYDFDLKVTGEFGVHGDETQYFGSDSLSREQERLRVVRDLADVVIPNLKAAYSADRAWNNSIRETYRQAQAAELRRRAAAIR